jgi:hypothetical protein
VRQATTLKWLKKLQQYLHLNDEDQTSKVQILTSCIKQDQF